MALFFAHLYGGLEQWVGQFHRHRVWIRKHIPSRYAVTWQGGSPYCCSCCLRCCCCDSQSDSSWRCCSSCRHVSRAKRPCSTIPLLSALTQMEYYYTLFSLTQEYLHEQDDQKYCLNFFRSFLHLFLPANTERFSSATSC